MQTIISTNFSAERNQAQSVVQNDSFSPTAADATDRSALPGRMRLSTMPRMKALSVRTITIRTPLAPVFLSTAVSSTIEWEHMIIVQRMVRARQSRSRVDITAMAEYTFTK